MATREPALRLIITYKLVRGAAAAIAGVAMLAALAFHLDAFLRDQSMIRLSGPARELATWLLEPRHVLGAGVLVTLDGLVTMLESWALFRGWRWGVWLVVGASMALLPFELAALVERVSPLRLSLLLVNLLIVFWVFKNRGAISGTPEEGETSAQVAR